jgi:hypothetical protein
MTTQAYQFDPTDLPGATRIGPVWLSVPPINIHFNEHKFETSQTTMRQQGPTIIKTGRGIWSVDMDLVFSGTSVINDKLVKLLATLRRTPFITIRNETIQKIVFYNANDNGFASDIPIAVNGYVLRTEPDLPDTLIMRLSMTVFNFQALVGHWQYLRQIIDENNIISTVPALSIEDSNLFRQYYESLIKTTNNPVFNNFMFDGEIEKRGELTIAEATRQGLNKKTPDNDLYFTSRANLDAKVLRNGQAIRQIGSDYTQGANSITIGYHVMDLVKALDLGLGAYKSRQSGKWIGTKEELRTDVIRHLTTRGIAFDEKSSTTDLVNQNLDNLLDIAVANNADKYIKRYSLINSESCVIDGLTLRRSFPISVIPITSSPVPSCQYLGGADTSFVVNFVTNNEELVKCFMGVDKAIEESARNVSRHGGSELIYIENDLINLNGTFVVDTGEVDIQNIPDNPGTYNISWKLNEQTEILSVLNSKIIERRNFKRKFVESILTFYKGWKYSDSHKLNTWKFNFSEAEPSYTKVLLIPSMIRLVRNAFIRWLRERGRFDSSTLGASVTHNNPFAIATEWFLDPLGIFRNRIRSTAGVIAHLEGYEPISLETLFRTESPVQEQTGTAITTDGSKLPIYQTETQRKQTKHRAYSYNYIWQTITGNPARPNTAPWNMMRAFLLEKSKEYPGYTTPLSDNEEDLNRQILQGAAVVIVNSDCRRLEHLLRSPKLLEYEVRLMYNTNLTMPQKVAALNARLANAKTFAEQTEIMNNVPQELEDFVNMDLFTFKDVEEYNKTHGLSNGTNSELQQGLQKFLGPSSMSCYLDLGIPFTYFIEKNDGQPLYNDKGKRVQDIKFSPSFYLKESAPLLPEEKREVSLVEIDDHLALANNSLLSLAESRSLPSIERVNTYATNDIMNLNGYEGLGETNSTTNKADAITSDSLEQEIKSIQKNANKSLGKLQEQGLLSEQTSTKIKTFKTVDELFLSNSLVSSLGSFGNETSPLIIEEAQYEHRLWKSSFKDFNPDIDKTIAYIIKQARDSITKDKQYYSINKAFPTYKLYFREENSPEWFLFDNFFDYRAIYEIRYYKDKATPASIVNIKLNNHKGILTDLEALLAKESFATEVRNSNERLINPYTNKPIKRLFVQSGTQIQLRVGYQANPDDLKVIFNGFITDVSPGEEFEIVAQGYGAELFSEAGVGSFLGWICPPKAFIWWMLLDSKVKHLGRLVQNSVLPNSACDILDGPAFDDNIYLNENMEPGKWRLLQSYNADNMTKWDVLQDIAAAHPGCICDVVPYDDRETVFFGRPDYNYKYTQDLGATEQYVDIPENIIPKLATLPVKQEDSEAVINAIKSRSMTPAINYMQWLRKKDILETAIEKWRQNHITGIMGKDIKAALEYCKIVDLLTWLAADPAVGNIQYDLIGKLELTPEQKNAPTKAATQASMPIPQQGDNTTSLPSEPSLDVAGSVRVTTTNLQNSRVYQPISLEFLAELSPSIRSSILHSSIGRTIALEEFFRDQNVHFVTEALRPDISFIIDPTSASLGDNSVNTASQKLERIQQTLNEYDLLGDTEVIKDKLKATDQGFVLPMLEVYKTYGIESPIAIVAWAWIYQILRQFGLTETGKEFKLFSGSPIETTITSSEKISISSIKNIKLQYTGPINRTDLKAHITLRNLILTNLIDISPEFQKILAEWARSPLEKRFRDYHLVTSYEHIVNNDIRLNLMGMWNSVKVKYKRHDFMDISLPFQPSTLWGEATNEFQIQAGDTLDQRVTREKVFPIENAKTVWQARNYATSLLADGVREMYQGTLTIRGNPNIKTNDIIYVYDDYVKMYGPIEVKSVTHIMSADTGFITIIEPHAYVETMGTDVGPASVIAEIFDILLVITMVIPPLWEAGTAVKAGVIAQRGGMTLAKQALKDSAVKTVASGKSMANWVAQRVGSTSQIYAQKRAAVATRSVSEILTKHNMSGKSIDDVISIVNQGRNAKNAKAITQIHEASASELNIALRKTAGVAEGSDAALAIERSLATWELNMAKAGLQTTKDLAETLMASTLGVAYGQLTGVSLINFLKVSSVIGPIAYYQLFAGMDDKNYACPLRIVPLSYRGSPYYAGLEGLTHQSGIWEHIKGEWRKFVGSVRTIGETLYELESNYMGSMQ